MSHFFKRHALKNLLARFMLYCEMKTIKQGGYSYESG